MFQSAAQYRLIAEVKIRRESFGGILYKYGCADRGALSFITSPQLFTTLAPTDTFPRKDGDPHKWLQAVKGGEAFVI